MESKTFWSGCKAKVREWVDGQLAGTHNHFLCHLSGKPGLLSGLLLKRTFSHVAVSSDRVPAVGRAAGAGTVVYVTKYKSYFEYLFYQTPYRGADLPQPEIALSYAPFLFQPLANICRMLLARADCLYQRHTFPDPFASGYIRDALGCGRTGILALNERRGALGRLLCKTPDPLQYLISIQSDLERPLYIVPQLMFFSKMPDRSVPALSDMLFGTKENPGRLRRLFTAFNKPGTVFVEIAEPLNLKEFLARPEVSGLSLERRSFALRQQLLIRMNRLRQSVTGPVVKTRQELKDSILADSRLQEFMEHFSEKRNVPVREMYEKADGFLDEIAADFNPAVLRLANRVVGFVVNNMFDGVSIDGSEISAIRDLSQKGPLILIPCHKSHVDYLLLPYVLYNNNMPCPHAVAGKNLFFWPLGSIFRALGAFSIRRTFSGAVLYAKVFEEYIRKVLEEGFNIELFIEGGRSRTGKLMSPKLGFLSLLLTAFKKGACEDMIFVPVYIGYDQVLEEGAYLHEVSGGEKKPESLLGLIKAGKFLKKRYGKIYLKFQAPVSLNALVAEQGKTFADMSTKEQNMLCRSLGGRVMNAINRATVVTPHALVASAILAHSHNKIAYAQLLAHVRVFMGYLAAQQATFADILSDEVRAVERVLYSYAQRKLIEPVPSGDSWPTRDTLYIINEHKRPELEYYKNNIIAFFVPAAYVALAILRRDAFEFAAAELYGGFDFFADLFQNEFIAEVDRTTQDCVQENLQVFLASGIITTHPAGEDGRYNLTPEGLKQLQLYGSFLRTLFESYWVVLSFFKQTARESALSGGRLKHIQSLGDRMYKRMEIDRKEALSKITFGHAEKYFVSRGIKGSEDVEKIQRYADELQGCLAAL